ncbi:MAG TPA: selenocysteine-specific translation elongation factor [Burkholderiales bacterium]|nr:selenocysteine-specific translation elongation factor [Burkholderiales bacterium]
MIVATAGHIDHGKTTLVRALTGVDTDRLPEEKARGISIDLGFAYWRTPGDGLTVGFVDVPGHERFVRNMLAGVCGIDYVMLVVAADDGVMPQTVEHLQIIELLSVKSGLALITKIDRSSPQRTEEVAASVKELLASTGLAAIDVVPVSALSGSGMDRVRAALADAARTLHHQGQQGRRFRFAIDRVFTVAGSGTVATGTVFAGAAGPGDKLTLSPAGVEVRVRTIQKDGKVAAQAAAGERCALNLSGVEVADAGRGDWLVAPALHAPTQRLDVRLQLLGSETRPLKHWTPVHLHHGAKDVTARISIRRGAEIRPGESALAQLIVDKPIAALNGDRFIVRDQSALRTIGGGAVIDPFAPPRRRDPELRASQLRALETADPQDALGALLACSPSGVNLSWFARIFNLDDEHLAALVRSHDLVVVGKELRTGLSRASVETVNASVRDALTRFHGATPRALGMEIAVLRRACAPQLAAETFAFLLRLLADERQIELKGSIANLPQHVATDNPADESLWRRVRPVLDGAGFNGLTTAELATAAKIREPMLKDFLHRKAKTGELVRVTPERFYLRATLAQFAAIAESVFRVAPEGRFSAAQVRDRTDIGRTRAIQILECFDRLGITQRIGDLRVIRRDFVPILGPSAQQRSKA